MAPVMSRQGSRARAEAALRLRARGRSWTEISADLGFRSRDGARLAVDRLLAQTAPSETVDRSRRTAVETLRITTSALHDRFSVAVEKGDDDAIAKLNKELRGNVSETAKLLGLYAPVQHNVDVTVQQSATAILDRAEQELLALAATDNNIIDAEVIE